MTRVKICGIRRPEDALLAAELGAWAIGFIFHAPSPRAIDPSEARRIVDQLRRNNRGADVLAAGVFVDRSIGEIREIAEIAGLDVVQLHGAELPSVASAVRAREVWKAFRVGPAFDSDAALRFPSVARILLDTYRRDRPGGTGEVFDWTIAREIARKRSLILAGGIRPENVTAAIEVVRPFAIDVSSGVESAPGVKDPELLRALFRAVQHVS